MLPLYLFSLVLGGGFLVASLLGGLVDLHGDFSGHAEIPAGHDLASEHAAAKIFSIRGLIYGLFGFGAVGTALTLTGGATLLTALAAALAGFLTAAMVTALFAFVRKEELPDREGDDGFVGLAGRVTLPITTGNPGNILVERAGRHVQLRALPHEVGAGRDPQSWKTVVVVEMQGGVARVTPVENDLSPGS